MFSIAQKEVKNNKNNTAISRMKSRSKQVAAVSVALLRKKERGSVIPLTKY